eukprot:TRINITY_DN109933_c0_g1_i1.p1 TRINITY_DN109933_c0_g1~~TRINITY_DN109933_c0_g1_i1.p1  ORF type:complete len:256 (+),score=41.29 TRINITY_DN109933_c0_g1_i1:32-769(+)
MAWSTAALRPLPRPGCLVQLRSVTSHSRPWQLREVRLLRRGGLQAQEHAGRVVAGSIAAVAAGRRSARHRLASVEISKSCRATSDRRGCFVSARQIGVGVLTTFFVMSLFNKAWALENDIDEVLASCEAAGEYDMIYAPFDTSFFLTRPALTCLLLFYTFLRQVSVDRQLEEAGLRTKNSTWTSADWMESVGFFLVLCFLAWWFLLLATNIPPCLQSYAAKTESINPAWSSFIQWYIDVFYKQIW